MNHAPTGFVSGGTVIFSGDVSPPAQPPGQGLSSWWYRDTSAPAQTHGRKLPWFLAGRHERHLCVAVVGSPLLKGHFESLTKLLLGVTSTEGLAWSLSSRKSWRTAASLGAGATDCTD